MKKLVLVSGYFDPLGPQHLALFSEAAKLGDVLIIGVNSDSSLSLKKGQPPFMPLEERLTLCNAIKGVHLAVSFEDFEGTACKFLEWGYNEFHECYDIVFANGGDRRPDGIPIPEEKWCKEQGLNIEFVYGVGGTEKIRSSSDYLRDWVNNTMVRYGQSFRLETKY